MQKFTAYRFAAAAETEPIVFGAARPGYRSEQVEDWMAFMVQNGIQRVCCLLSEQQLQRYDGLLRSYKSCFGPASILWAPIEDFRLVEVDKLRQILDFLSTAEKLEKPVVVHCSGGVGRTGQVLTAWLMARRGLSLELAIASVRRAGRNPYEAIIAAPLLGRNPWQVSSEFQALMLAIAGHKR